MIFIEPSEQRSNSLWPKEIDAVKCPGLEEKTGADFVICQLPINPVVDVQWHIDNRSAFVQTKFGHDVTSFEQTNKEIARAQACVISLIILFIGQDDKSTDGKLSIDNFVSGIDFRNYLIAKAKWQDNRGVKFDQIPHSDCLSDWVVAREKAILDKRKEIKVYPTSGPIYQGIEEIPRDDLRSILCRGLPNFGPEKAQAIVDFLKEKKVPRNLFNALAFLSDIDEDCKPIYQNIPKWGKKSFWDLRKVLGIPNPFNLGWLSAHEDKKDDLAKGAKITLERIIEKTRDGKTGQEAFKEILKEIEWWIS